MSAVERSPLQRAASIGALVGVVNIAWLYVSFYLGLHTNGLLVFQLVPAVWLMITVAGFVAGLRRLAAAHGRVPYWRGVGYGMVVTLLTTAIAVPMQWGYYTFINPDWPAYMLEQTRAHFSAAGAPPDEIARQMARARETFSMWSYAAQSAAAALVTGTLLSLIIAYFLRTKTARIASSAMAIAFISMSAAVGACGGQASPAAPAPTAAVPLFFDSAGARLSYQIDRPSGAGPFRGIVLGHERGAITKSHSALLTAELTGAGFAVLRFDKRGTGESTGTFEDISVANSERVVDQLAADLVAAVDTLTQQPGVMAGGVGLIGASEAGWSLPRAATMTANVKFIAAIASPTVPVGARNFFWDQAADPTRSLDALSGMLAAFTGPFGYDPRTTLSRVTVPTLWIVAASDRIVPSRESASVIAELAAAGRPFTVATLAGDHDIRLTSSYFPALTAWLTGVR